MLPEISEFSYGFALTNELVGWLELSAAPVFPSLIEEGKAGGGYDVKLERPGAPLYLQFKRSEYMTRRSAREYRDIGRHGADLGVPFFRFAITEKSKSDQHDLLLSLDTSPNHVYYVAPQFHRVTEINHAWQTNTVSGRSLFVSPSEIGSLDDERHTVAFDGTDHWLCSEPRRIRGLSSRDVLENMQSALRADDRPLRVRLPEVLEDLRVAEERGRERIAEKVQEAERRAEALRPVREQPDEVIAEFRAAPLYISVSPRRELGAPEPTPPVAREPKALPPELLALRQASDIAARVFDAQLVIVQPPE